MTRAGGNRSGLIPEFRDILATVAPPHNEPPALIRRRRVIVAAVLVVGASLLGYSLSRPPGDEAFYWLTLALAAAWATGALVSGPVHMGHVRFRGRNQRPVITGVAVGLLLGGVFIIGALVAREIGPVREQVARVLEFANYGPLWLVVFTTVINGLAEEMFFRGALYTALGNLYPVAISTVLYVAVTSTTGNPMLSLAAIILGTVCAIERRATGGVLAPMLTHFCWGLIMAMALPPIFGV